VPIDLFSRLGLLDHGDARRTPKAGTFVRSSVPLDDDNLPAIPGTR
jgi:hypothetical protein